MPSGIYARTQKHSEAIANGIKGHLPSTAFKKGQTPWNKGLKGLQEWHDISGLNRGFPKGHPCYYKGNPLFVKCEVCAKEFRTYACKIKQGKGKYCSKGCYYASKKGKPQPNRRGEKSHFWRGGVTPLNKAIRNLFEYRAWRHKVFTRDKFTCAECHKIGGRLHPHHIKPVSEIIQANNIKTLLEAQFCEELWNIDNGVTLCVDCHSITESYGWKLMWSNK